MKKKRFFVRLLPLLLPACTVDTPVAENSAPLDDRLGEDLRPWCETACDKRRNCRIDAEDDWPEECVQGFTTAFLGKGELCEAIGLGVMDCYDTATCSQLAAGACDDEGAQDRCLASQGQVSCSQHGVGDSESGGTGGAGGISLSCSVYYDQCSDDRFYSVYCEGSDPLECDCTNGGISNGRFRHAGLSCPDWYEAREICGWSIRPWSGEPQTLPVICNAGLVIPMANGGCEIEVGDCADAGTYGVICDGATNLCSCLEDGEAVEAVGDVIASDSVCPYVNDPDAGFAAMNAACGFRVAWPDVDE